MDCQTMSLLDLKEALKRAEEAGAEDSTPVYFAGLATYERPGVINAVRHINDGFRRIELGPRR